MKSLTLVNTLRGLSHDARASKCLPGEHDARRARRLLKLRGSKANSFTPHYATPTTPRPKIGRKIVISPDGPRGATGAPNCSSHHPNNDNAMWALVH